MPFAAVAGAVIGGAIQADGAKSAAKTQAKATRDAAQLQDAQYQQTRDDQVNYRNRGNDALALLYGETSKPPTLSAAEIMSDPGYAFGQQQGQRALDQRIAASGGRVSGAALKASARYGTDYASTGYNAAYQRRQDRLNRLAAIAGLGQTATQGTAMAGMNAANNVSALTSAQGNASAAGQIAQGNIWGSAANQLGALYSRGSTGGGNGVGSGSTWFNDPTDPSGKYATNGSDAGWSVSDRRLKTNIRRIGTTARGNAVYVWDWKDGSGTAAGVVAQEVTHIPGATRRREDGVLTVDYSKV